MMNTVNASTGLTPFFLHSDHSPRLIPPLLPSNTTVSKGSSLDQARKCVQSIQTAVKEAQDTLFEHKTRQAHFANQHRGPEDTFAVGDRVMLSTSNWCREYKATGQERTAKLMPRSDGPFKVIRVYPERSSYTLRLPGSTRTFPGFYSSQLH